MQIYIIYKQKYIDKISISAKLQNNFIVKNIQIYILNILNILLY